MVLNDVLANAMSNILNNEKKGKDSCIIRPSAKLTKKVLEIMKDHMYVGNFEEVKDGKGNVLKLNLLGNINKCGVIKPRHAVKINNFEKFEKRFLPAKDFGIIIVSTTKGLMTHIEAKEKGFGGKLLAYIY
ncbi:MAG: 30S ribosomal protein S8 [Nanoarchaeota archaeon]|nr:30S ribosomal protein S8 [Nanoarchaeota archaeon]